MKAQHHLNQLSANRCWTDDGGNVDEMEVGSEGNKRMDGSFFHLVVE